MTRIESGAIRLHLSRVIFRCDRYALEQLGKRVAEHDIKVNIPDDFPLVPMDFTLIVQVVVNLLENAVKYSGQSVGGLVVLQGATGKPAGAYDDVDLPSAHCVTPGGGQQVESMA